MPTLVRAGNEPDEPPTRATAGRAISRRRLTLFLVAAGWSAHAAAQAVIPDDLQQEAMTCVGEAMQICPDVWTAEDHGLACMTGRRQGFSPRCRVIYDKVAKALKR